jgi:hypothetical protein
MSVNRDPWLRSRGSTRRAGLDGDLELDECGTTRPSSQVEIAKSPTWRRSKRFVMTHLRSCPTLSTVHVGRNSAPSQSDVELVES